jgi:hypothetical protein
MYTYVWQGANVLACEAMANLAYMVQFMWEYPLYQMCAQRLSLMICGAQRMKDEMALYHKNAPLFARDRTGLTGPLQRA